jgi:predicted nuclease of restriction endonuclease-like (RecB) superfamily
MLSARSQAVRHINSTMVSAYFEVGRMIVEDEQKGLSKAEYGEQVLLKLSQELTQEFGNGFSERNLEAMRKFYLVYSISQTLSAKLTKGQTVSAQSPALPKSFQLSWSHYVFLIRLDESRRNFYEIEAAQNNWSLRELKRQFNSALYERLSLNKNPNEILKLSTKGQIIEKPTDLVKDPYIFEFLGLQENKNYSETDLETKIIDNLETFLLELGKGFTFVARQQRISFSEQHFFIDLVFYNRLLSCFVIFDLKIGEFKHQDIGQLQMYINYYDRKIKISNENPTIGILLCADKEDAVVEMTLPENNQQLFASKYKLYLPTKEELIWQIRQQSSN